MQSVILGKTGLNVSRLSFGGIPIQRADAANTRAVVDQLEQHGVNFLDTARGYTVSEDYLGAALEGRRDHFILATKSMSRDYAGMQKDIDNRSLKSCEKSAAVPTPASSPGSVKNCVDHGRGSKIQCRRYRPPRRLSFPRCAFAAPPPRPASPHPSVNSRSGYAPAY